MADGQRVSAAGVREWASLAMLDAIDLAVELGMLWGDEAGRRRATLSDLFRGSPRQLVLTEEQHEQERDKYVYPDVDIVGLRC